MKAIVISHPGEAEVLQLREVPEPRLEAGQVLIRVKAAGLNHSDIFLRKGTYKGIDPSGQIPGLEVAGVVEQCGTKTDRWQIGDRVCALVPVGAYAQYVAVDERHCLPIPAELSFEEAASLPEATFTVWYTVFQQAKLQAGEHILIHGGSSGIGTIAIQLVTAFGAIAFATAGNGEKCLFCEQLGARQCINYQAEDFELALKKHGFDVILDIVGGPYTLKNLRLLNPEGRLIFINAIQGAKTEINILDVMNKRLVISGSVLKPRSADFKAQLATQVKQHVWPLLTTRLKPIIYQIFPLEEACDAHRLMESSQHIGKIILRIV